MQCSKCKNILSTSKQLRIHMKNVHGNRKFKCPVEGCSVTFTTKSSFKEHLRTKHPLTDLQIQFYIDTASKTNQPRKGNTFKCAICNKLLKTKNNLRDHVKTHDESQKKNECEKCGQYFSKKSNLNRHIVKCLNEPKMISGSDKPPMTLDSSNGQEKSLGSHEPPMISEKESGRAEFIEIQNNKLSRKISQQLIKDMDSCDCTDSTCADSTCINRATLYECMPTKFHADCQNMRVQNLQIPPLEIFETTEKGMGVRSKTKVQQGTFIVEYVGEIIEKTKYLQRLKTTYSGPHFYGLSFGNYVIDAHEMGNISRYINHSCEANCHTEHWIVNGLPRMIICATREINEGEELTIDYKFEAFGQSKPPCRCGSPRCVRMV